MSAIFERVVQRRWNVFRAELAPYPGRADFAWRLVLASAFVIVFSSAYGVPYLSLSVLAVFYTMQSNAVVTRIVGVVMIATAVFASAADIIMLRYTFSYPALRLICSAAILFASMYCMRILTLGPAFLGPAIVCTYGQTFAAMTDNTEYIVNQSLWSLLAMLYAIVVALIVAARVFAIEPSRQLRDEAGRQLARIAARLESLAAGTRPETPISDKAVVGSVASMEKLLTFAGLGGSDRAAGLQAYRQAAAATVSELLHAAEALPEDADAVPVADRLREEVVSLAGAFAEGRVYHMAWKPSPAEAAALRGRPGLEAMRASLAALDRFTPPETGGKKGMPMVVPDAFSNPAYIRFALKAVLATMIAYIFYISVDWEGIHTVMLTCIIAAYPTLGASLRKMILRFYGAILGTLCALFVFIFVMPRLEGIVGLLLAVLPVLALGSWIAAGSERIAYLGVQAVFTFSLALFDHPRPSTDLTSLRDRIIGIFLGIGICLVIYPNIWPESEAGPVRKKLGELLRAISELVRPWHAGKGGETVVAAGEGGDEGEMLARHMNYAKARMHAVALLAGYKETIDRVSLEYEYKTGATAERVRNAEEIIEPLREIMRIRADFHDREHRSEPVAANTSAAILMTRRRAADLLAAAAETVERNAAPPREERESLLAAERELAALAGGRDAPLIDNIRRLADRVAELHYQTDPSPHSSTAASEVHPS